MTVTDLDATDQVLRRPNSLARTRVGRVRPGLSVTLLGGFLLHAGEDSVELPATAQRLVALLALRGRMSRSRLAGTLWPETAEQRALASLRTGLWRTSQAAERLVTCTGGMVDLDARVDVDMRRFVVEALQFMHGGGAHESGSPPPARRDADYAVDVLVTDGELLPDWEEEWLLFERERVRQLRLHVLEKMATHLCLAGEFGLALEVALASLRVDPMRESAHRRVIQTHLAEGNVAEARRALEACRDTLTRDVGVDPSPETVALVPRQRHSHTAMLETPAAR
jgi:DNA-binding SARP family transcriptional activator